MGYAGKTPGLDATGGRFITGQSQQRNRTGIGSANDLEDCHGTHDDRLVLHR